MELVLPRSTVELIGKVRLNERHPGLQLDKYSSAGEQTRQREALDKVCQTVGDKDFFKLLGQRREKVLHTLPGNSCFSCTTVGPLTLHLSRASALENAGICLHPLYGFVYLPGSGLKGMARAYAETVWLPSQTDQQQAWRMVESVFGWAPGSDKGKDWKPKGIPDRSKEDNVHVGNIVFHDAWPTEWPRLIVDIVNNHHPDYYQAEPTDISHPPGDWENPVPVYFLAVPPETTFQFALSPRRSNVEPKLLERAKEWLLGALCHLGAGAKTAAGYGSFRPTNEPPPQLPSSSRESFETTLELVTPAFLAGATQQKDDCDLRPATLHCDLRPATLRGLLRWWWRTMHAGYVDVATLRRMDAALWGDTKSGGAVQVELSTTTASRKSLYSHPEERQSGTRYIAYGMDEMSRGQRKRRFRLDPPASWRLRLVARRMEFGGKTFASGHVLEQAKAALWLLCNYGGVGSKARKGFGSLIAEQNDFTDFERCQNTARDFRQQSAIGSGFSTDLACSPSISDPELQRLEMPCQPASADDILDWIGRAYSAVAARFKHNIDQEGVIQSPNKAAWGLPRKIHGPRDAPLRHQSAATHQRPEWLDFPKRPRNMQMQNARHASPIHIHVAKSITGDFLVRFLAMPAIYLPDRAKNIEMLKAFRMAFEQQLLVIMQRQNESRGGQIVRPATPARRSSSADTPVSVRVKFLGPHDKLKNAFWVQEEGKKRGLLKYGTPRTPLPTVDSEIEVYRTSDNAQSPEYRWDRPESRDQTRGGGRPRGGRR